MDKIRMTLAYDGTDFAGWQVQKRDRTVQGEVEKALSEINGKPVRIVAAGRTDSGVHARGQVIHFHTEVSIPPEKYALALNTKLPRDVRAMESSQVPDRFHSRFDARLRVYRYYILNAVICPPMFDRYCWTFKRSIDIRKLNELAGTLRGEHDFTTFASAGDPSDNKVRNLTRISFFTRDGFLVFEIAATAFLWKMVRSVLGTLLELEEQQAIADEMREILNSRDRSRAGTTAPARGLFLEKVYYHE
jgi:tRNA pseudouridine38-40 synthase